METINVPIRATYRYIDGEMVMVDAEYADVPVDAVARLLGPAFRAAMREKKEGDAD